MLSFHMLNLVKTHLPLLRVQGSLEANLPCNFNGKAHLIPEDGDLIDHKSVILHL